MEPWKNLDDADKSPGPITDVELLMPDGTVIVGHYAYGDGDGLMPPFRGWFKKVGSGPGGYFKGIDPIKWREIAQETP